MECYNCGRLDADLVTELYGHFICEPCKNSLRFFSDEKIKTHVSNFSNQSTDSEYRKEIIRRLEFIQRDYINKKIKLFHVLDRLDAMNL